MFTAHGTRVNPIVQSASLWLRSGPFRQKAIEALTVTTGFPTRLVEIGIENAFRVITPAALRFTTKPVDSKTILIVCPSNVFTAWLPPAVTALAMGYSVWLKPSVHEPAFPHLWCNSLSMVDRGLAERVRLVPWRKSIYELADAVIAYGADEAVADLKRACGKKPFLGFGHQISVGILFREALGPKRIEATHEAVRSAVEPFRLQGCLSPQTLYIQGSFQPQLPHPLPLPPLQSFREKVDLLHLLSAIPYRLACVGWAGNDQTLQRLRPALTRLGVDRICPIDEMQRPPLDWPNGGVDLVEWLGNLQL